MVIPNELENQKIVRIAFLQDFFSIRGKEE